MDQIEKDDGKGSNNKKIFKSEIIGNKKNQMEYHENFLLSHEKFEKNTVEQFL